jgi:hypothetical protein
MRSIDLIVKRLHFIQEHYNQLAELKFIFLGSLPSDQRILALYRGLTAQKSIGGGTF